MLLKLNIPKHITNTAAIPNKQQYTIVVKYIYYRLMK